MKINAITLNRLRNDANFQFHTEFKSLAEKLGPEALKIEPQLEAYLPLYDKVDLALKKIVKSAITEQIQEADKARDNIWKGLTETNATALRHFDEPVREAAKRLKIVFDTYGNIAKKSLNEQTSATYNILQDLEGRHSSDAAAAGLGSWVSELKARNTAFAELVRDRVDESSLKVDIVLKKARAQLDDAYYAIAERVNALAVVEGASNYEPFIKKMNVNVAKYSTLMPARKKQGLAKKTSVLAMVIFSMMLFPSHADASWLGIVKGIIGGVIGVVQIPVSKLADEPAPKPAPKPAPEQASKPDTPPTPLEILDALNKLGSECKSIASKGIPCVIEGGRGTTPENAKRVANRAAIAAMGMAINTYVKGNTDLIRKQLEEDGIPTDVNEFDEKITLSVNQNVSGAQTFLSYLYIDEDATKKKGQKVYVATEVMVLNSEIFGKALEETAAGKSIGQQLIDETRKGVVARLKSIFTRKQP